MEKGKIRKGEMEMINIRLTPFMAGCGCERAAWPLVDISESNENFTLKFEIPGAAKEDIKIWIENDLLSISGEKKNDSDSERLVAEREFGKFERSFKLPSAVDRNNVLAELLDGILTIKLPKVVEANEIPIK
jgi:HSP20 family protein